MEERRFILERFYVGWQINLFVLNKEKDIMEVYDKSNPIQKEVSEKIRKDSMPKMTKILLNRMYDSCCEKKCPLIFPEEDGIFYMAFLGEEEGLYILGPVSADDISFAQNISYRRRHGVQEQKFQIPKMSLAKALNGLILLYFMLTGRRTSEDEILSESNHINSDREELGIGEEKAMIYKIQKMTEEKSHLTYQDELRWLAEIENGTRMDSRKLIDSDNVEKLERIGIFSNQNALKQYEYMLVASTTLACRAAIRGGMSAFDAYHLADMYFQKVSICTDIMQILQLYVEMADEYSSQVRKARDNQSSDIIDQCKEYIARYRTKKFSLAEMAKEMGKNPSYLSRVFSERTHKTLQEYALEKRLEAGANLLKHSEQSIGEIAEYLNFPSQSYFGERFKKMYGQSPGEFRTTHKIHDFKK